MGVRLIRENTLMVIDAYLGIFEVDLAQGELFDADMYMHSD